MLLSYKILRIRKNAGWLVPETDGVSRNYKFPVDLPVNPPAPDSEGEEDVCGRIYFVWSSPTHIPRILRPFDLWEWFLLDSCVQNKYQLRHNYYLIIIRFNNHGLRWVSDNVHRKQT